MQNVKKIFLFLLLILSSFAFSQSWLSLDSLSGDSEVTIGNFEISKSGSIYLTGYAHNNSLFKNHVFNNGHRYTNFVAKLDANLNLKWLKEIPATAQNFNKLAIDNNENIYYTFYTINNCMVGTYTINYSRGENVILKIDSSGNIKKAYNFGDRYTGIGGYNSPFYSISVKNKDFISLSFTYSDSAFLANDTLTSSLPGIEHYAILNMDSNLNEISHFTIPVSAYNIKHDNSGKLCISGQYNSVGQLHWGSVVLPPSCTEGGVIARLDSLGNPLWAKYINTVGACYGGQIAYTAYFGEIAFDKSDNVYSTGFYMSNSNYSGMSLNYTSPSSFYLNYFFTKIDPSGSIVWCKRVNSSRNTFGASLIVDSCGNACVLGVFADTVSSGSYNLIQQHPTYQENSIMVIEYDANGNTINMLMGESHFGSYYIRSFPSQLHKALVIGNCSWYDSYFGSFSIPSSDNYNLIFATSFNTVNFCNLTTMINSNAGISDQIKVYPNPSRGNINLTSTGTIDEIKVVDVIGQVVYQATPKTMNTTITLKSIGVYFITITTETGIITKKIIINE